MVVSSSSLIWSSPTRIDIPPSLVGQVRSLLRVTDKSADFQLKKARRGEEWMRSSLGDKEYDKKVAALEARKDRNLLREDKTGAWVPSGVRGLLSEQLGLRVEQRFDQGEMSPLPWKVTPRELFGGDPFAHQQMGAEAIWSGAGPSTVELPCGTGKSLMFALILREIGRRAAVLASSRVIADQLYSLLLALLGPRFVGQYNGDSKGIGKLITVCSAMATKNLRPGSAAWEHLSAVEVLLGDECHTFAADVLESQALGLFAAARWRGFATASKVRSDGLEKILLGVVGPTAYGLTFRQAVEAGLLAKPHLVSVEIDSGVEYWSRDADRMTRAHLYESEGVADLAADMTIGLMAAGYSVLLLVDEFPQAAMLARRLPGVLVMHGGTGSYSVVLDLEGVEPMEVSPGRLLHFRGGLLLSADRAMEAWRTDREAVSELVPAEGGGPPLRVLGIKKSGESGQQLLPPHLRDREVADVQRAFNEAESPTAMIATSAGRVGVDIRPARNMAVLYLVGGTSEVSLVQGMGRATRPQGKDHFLFVDFRVPALDRHFLARREILERMWGRPTEVSVEQVRKVWGRS